MKNLISIVVVVCSFSILVLAGETKAKDDGRKPNSMPWVTPVGKIEDNQVVRIEDKDNGVVCYAVSGRVLSPGGSGTGISCVKVN